MSTNAMPQEFGVLLCNAVGLDPKQVRKIAIESDAAAGTVYIHAQLYLRSDQGVAIGTQLARYELHEIARGMADPLDGEAVSHDARHNNDVLEHLYNG